MLALLALGAANAATAVYYTPRILLWRDADVADHERFPSRVVRTAPPSYEYRKAPTYPDSDPRLQTMTDPRDGEQRPLGDFLAGTGTTAVVVIHRDRLVYEQYLNGYSRDSTQTSFSVAKSFLSALVGIAIEEGRIRSVDDPITGYVPELLRRDPRFGRVTIRHLLTMSSGLRYNDEGSPWSNDDARTYYAPDLRKLALEESRVEGEPGQRFEYNNYHPLLLGLILERTTGMPVARYLQEKLWRPLGMEADGSWSLDSERSGFEKLESGINGRAIDFAKLGSLYLRGGRWRGRQLVPAEWVEESTRAHADTPSEADYGYFWWVGEGGRYSARGNHGQLIYVAPDRDLVMVRFGTRFGLEGHSEDWVRVFDELAERFDRRADATGRMTRLHTSGGSSYPTNEP
jgi:CubicO group peptidase (beta-lactamase class C family)